MTRQQTTRVTTRQYKKRIKIAAIIGITLLLAAAVVFIYLYEFPDSNDPYAPPPFEKNAALGVPEPDEHMQYNPIDADGKFVLGAVGTLFFQKDFSLELYFTNYEENDVYLLAEVYDYENERLLYRSGIIRPGEYVQTLEPLHPIEQIGNVETKVQVLVYAFSTEDYVSMGQVTLDNIIQPNYS